MGCGVGVRGGLWWERWCGVWCGGAGWVVVGEVVWGVVWGCGVGCDGRGGVSDSSKLFSPKISAQKYPR